MWQREQGVDGEDDKRQEWLCSGWRPGAAGEQLGTVNWMGEPWAGSSRVLRRTLLRGVEQQLLGGGHSSMRGDQKWQSRLAQVVEDGDCKWGVLAVYPVGGADGTGTPAS